MIKNLFNQKQKKNNKRGSMLTLVLVILAMALILITSAISITNSTRSRYFDYTLSNQARTTATAVAETFVTAIQTQEILDSELESMATAKTTVSVSGPAIPGLKSSSGSTTTVKFSSSGKVIYMDVSTTIGTTTENVRVYLQKKAPDGESSLFNHVIEIGDNCSFSSFNVGAGAPPGADNTVFVHGDSDLTKNGGNTMESDIISTGRIYLGNGGPMTGDLLFAGPAAGVKSTSTGGSPFANWYFMSPSESGKGTVFETSASGCKIDVQSVQNVTLYNFELNGKLGQNDEVANWYNYGSASVNVGGTNADSYNAKVNASMSNNSLNSDLSSKAEKKLNEAVEALKPENAFPDVSTASAEFLKGISSTWLSKHPKTKIVAAAGGEIELEPGQYILPANLTARLKCDQRKGNYIFYVPEGDTCVISTGAILFENGNPDPKKQSTWGRVIIEKGGTLKIGGASATSPFQGILSCEHPTGGGPAKSLSKPTCFIYGYSDTYFSIENEGHYCDAYVGLYGDNSTINVKSFNYLYGRFAATNFTSDNANNTNFPYCPGPNDYASDGSKRPKGTDYEVTRFRYYYGTPPTT